MAEFSPIQTSFNGGKFGPRMKGRVDLQRYKYACEELQNFIPTTQGPAIKRSGTRFIKHAIANGVKSRGFPFEVSDEQAYVIELGSNKLRFFRGTAAVLEAAQTITVAPTAANPVSVGLTAHGYSNGDSVYITGSLMTELNGRFFTVSGATTDTFDLVGEDGTGRVTGLAGQVEKQHQLVDGVDSNSIPWVEADLPRIKVAQNGDLMYLVHPDYPVHLLTREGDLEWTCVEMPFSYPAFETENLTDTTVTISAGGTAVGASITITASAPIFTTSDVGRYFRVGDVLEADNGKWTAGATKNSTTKNGTGTAAVGDQYYYEGRLYSLENGTGSATWSYSPPTHEEGTRPEGTSDLRFINWGGYGYVEITAVNSTTEIVGTVIIAFSEIVDDEQCDKWSFSAWDHVNGYPRAVAFYEDRLFLGGTESEPQTFWASRSGEFDDFRAVPASQADSGLQFTLLSEKLNTIEWMKGDEVLVIGTTGSEFTVDSGSAAQAITPDNVRVRARSHYGTVNSIQPISLDSSILFVRRTNDVHELTFDFNTNRYIAPDLTQFNDTALRPGAAEVAYQADPFRQLWVLRTDGTLAALTYVKNEDVIAWADVVIGGTEAAVESIVTIPHPDGDEDQLWLFVRRTINGQTVRHVEVLEKPFQEGDAQEDAFFVDCGASYSGVAATTITGIWHLEGEEVVILADGARVPNQTVENGQIELDDEATDVQVGLQMPSTKLQTVRWDSATREGTSQGYSGRISNLALRVHNSGNGIEFGADFDVMDAWDRRTATMPIQDPVPLFTGDSPLLDLPGGWEQAKRVAVRYDEPLPCTIVAIIGKMDIEVR